MRKILLSLVFGVLFLSCSKTEECNHPAIGSESFTESYYYVIATTNSIPVDISNVNLDVRDMSGNFITFHSRLDNSTLLFKIHSSIPAVWLRVYFDYNYFSCISDVYTFIRPETNVFNSYAYAFAFSDNIVVGVSQPGYYNGSDFIPRSGQ